MPCHPECKVQEGKETCTGPVRGSLFSLGALLPPNGATVDIIILHFATDFEPFFSPSVSFKGADQCVACASLQDGPHCVTSCPEGVMGGDEVIFKYPNKQGRCEPCHINCTQG